MKNLFGTILILLSLSAFSQKNLNVRWTEFSIQNQLLSKFESALELQYRGNERFTKSPQFFFSPKLTYKPCSVISMRLLWRKTYDLDSQNSTNRVTGYLYYKNNSFKKIEIKNRFGYQVDQNNVEGYLPRLRNLITLKKKFKKCHYDPVMGFESFHVVEQKMNRLEKCRFIFGFERKLKRKKEKDNFIKSQTFKLFSKREWFVNDETELNKYILNLGYTVTI